MITTRYLIIRTIYAIVTGFVAIVLNFLLPRIGGTNPAISIVLLRNHYLKESQVKLLEAQFGLQPHTSIFLQFKDYIIQLLHGNLGISYYYYPESVSHVIFSHLPWTLYLLGISTLVSSILGVIFGRITGWRAGSKSESAVSSIFIGLTSLPFFWLALVFVLLFAVFLPIFPVGGVFSVFMVPGPNFSFIWSVIYHSILPIITIVITTFPAFALTMRNTMINQNKEDYLLMAKAKGIPQRIISKKYAGRNAILPVTTHIVLAFGYIVAGAFFVEVVFSYKGIGYVLYNAVESYDYWLIDGIFLIITFTVIIANYIVDLLYAILDPRVELR